MVFPVYRWFMMFWRFAQVRLSPASITFALGFWDSAMRMRAAIGGPTPAVRCTGQFGPRMAFESQAENFECFQMSPRPCHSRCPNWCPRPAFFAVFGGPGLTRNQYVTDSQHALGVHVPLSAPQILNVPRKNGQSKTADRRRFGPYLFW